MSEVWPLDVKNRLSRAAIDPLRPFKCVLLMPFEARFDQVAEIIKKSVSVVVEKFGLEHPAIVDRVDCITSSKVIQQEIWEKVAEADLIFCDITGFNPNVMFESGVCAAWKETQHVVFIKDHFFRQPPAFDIAPIRYTEYELTGDGINNFQEKIIELIRDVIIGFPDQQGSSPSIVLPLEIDFNNNQDDLRLYTPPLAHRRVVNGALEFGCLFFFTHSWASIGKNRLLNFALDFWASFSNPLSGGAWIGVGLRSQNPYANFAHTFYLRRDGNIIITEPDEESPKLYKDNVLREATPIDLTAYHHFKIVFNESTLSVQVDDFSHSFQVAQMKKVFGPGLIRFQSFNSWMAISQVKVTNGNVP